MIDRAGAGLLLPLALPAFEFTHDPLDYESLVHHCDHDICDYLREADLEQAALAMALVVCRAAMRDSLMPRMPR